MTTVLNPELESDPYLISLVRGGDTEAFGRLYERHVGAARRLARVLARDVSEADDLVAETFTKVLTALKAGRGPDTAFRAYVLTTLRHTLYDRSRRERRLEYTDDLTPYERPSTPDDPLVRTLESSYAARAFARLPERWRTVLWHTEVEGESPAQVAPLLGLTPNGVAALAYRARERLRQMYLQEHIEVTESPRCHWTGTHLAGYVRAQLARRDRTKVEDHLAECAECQVLHRELTEENSGLRGILATILLGSAAPGYLAPQSKALLAGVGAMFIALWNAITAWAAFLVGLGYKLVQLPRRLVERFGGGNVAAASGLVAAGMAGVTAFAVMAVTGDRDPAPPANALPMPAPLQSQPVIPLPTPSRFQPPTSPQAPPARVTPAPAPTTNHVTVAEAPVRPVIAHDPAQARLEAGQVGELPIAIRLPESTTQSQISMRVPFPPGLSLAGTDAGDGWTCSGSQDVTCERALPPPGGHTVARLPVAVGVELSGYQSIRVLVNDLEFVLRVPIAPTGMRLAFAALGPQGFGLGGNTLLACEPRPACLTRDNNEQDMVPIRAGIREPIPPTGLAEAEAASGARIKAGGDIRWAGLSVQASTTGELPSNARLHGPGGQWHDLSLTDGFADVTALLQAEGGGDWWLAVRAESLPAGRGQWAGWSLAVAHDEPGASPGELAVYLGPKQLRLGQELSLRLGAGGGVDVGMVIWDGDRSLGDDTLLLDNRPLGAATNAALGANPTSLLCAFTPGDCAWRTPGLDVLRHQATGSKDGLATLHAGNDPMEVGLLILLAQGPG